MGVDIHAYIWQHRHIRICTQKGTSGSFIVMLFLAGKKIVFVCIHVQLCMFKHICTYTQTRAYLHLYV